MEIARPGFIEGDDNRRAHVVMDMSERRAYQTAGFPDSEDPGTASTTAKPASSPDSIGRSRLVQGSSRGGCVGVVKPATADLVKDSLERNTF
jgi:hypothetical protein